jgi:hypothetical protein
VSKPSILVEPEVEFESAVNLLITTIPEPPGFETVVPVLPLEGLASPLFAAPDGPGGP